MKYYCDSEKKNDCTSESKKVEGRYTIDLEEGKNYNRQTTPLILNY